MKVFRGKQPDPKTAVIKGVGETIAETEEVEEEPSDREVAHSRLPWLLPALTPNDSIVPHIHTGYLHAFQQCMARQHARLSNLHCA